MAMQQSSTTEDAVPYINVTPLIDVLLVLLIIFMMISPLKPTRFEAKVPSEPDPQPANSLPNPNSLTVEINNEQKVKLTRFDAGVKVEEEMGTVTDPSALGTQLSNIFKTRETSGIYREGSTTEIEKTVFLKAPKSAKYGNIVKVIDTVKGAGATPIGLQVDSLD